MVQLPTGPVRGHQTSPTSRANALLYVDGKVGMTPKAEVRAGAALDQVVYRIQGQLLGVPRADDDHHRPRRGGRLPEVRVLLAHRVSDDDDAPSPWP